MFFSSVCFFVFFFCFCFLHRTEKPVTMPPNHVIEHHIARTDLGQTAKGFAVKLDGQAAAHVNPLKVE